MSMAWHRQRAVGRDRGTPGEDRESARGTKWAPRGGLGRTGLTHHVFHNCVKKYFLYWIYNAAAYAARSYLNAACTLSQVTGKLGHEKCISLWKRGKKRPEIVLELNSRATDIVSTYVLLTVQWFYSQHVQNGETEPAIVRSFFYAFVSSFLTKARFLPQVRWFNAIVWSDIVK
jgi:hypothetical protein